MIYSKKIIGNKVRNGFYSTLGETPLLIMDLADKDNLASLVINLLKLDAVNRYIKEEKDIVAYKDKKEVYNKLNVLSCQFFSKKIPETLILNSLAIKLIKAYYNQDIKYIKKACFGC